MKIWQRWKQTALHNKALVFSGILVAFGTVFYAGAAVVQICILKKSAEESTQAAQKIQEALDTANIRNGRAFRRTLEQSRNAMDVSNKQNQDALDVTIRNSRSDERPYIWAYPEPQPGTKKIGLTDLGEKVFIRITFKNSGRTPATNVIATASQMKVGPIEIARQEASSYIPEYKARTGSILVPDFPNVAATGEGPLMTNDLQDHILSGTWDVYVVGAIKYNDLIGPSATPYETIYCFRYNRSGLPYSPCGFGNSMK